MTTATKNCSVINVDVISVLKDIMEDDFANLVREFTQGGSQRIKNIVTAVKTGKPRAVNANSSALKSLSAQMGAEELSYVFAQIEAIAQTGTLEGCDALLVEASTLFDVACEELGGWV